MRIVTDYKHAQQIIVELDAEVERLEGELVKENKAWKKLLDEQIARIAKLEARVDELEAENSRLRGFGLRDTSEEENGNEH